MADNTAVAYHMAEDEDTVKTVINDELSYTIYQEVSMISSEVPPSQRDNALCKCVKKYQEHHVVLYFAGVYYQQIGRIDIATRFYEQCLIKYPLVDAFLNLAIIYHRRGDLNKTRSYLDQAVKVYPKEIRILNFLGALHYLDKDYPQCISYYKQIINDPQQNRESIEFKHIYNNIGFAYSAVGKCHKANTCFEKGLKIKAKTSEENQLELDVQLLDNKLLNYDYMVNLPKNTFNDYLRISELLVPVSYQGPIRKPTKIRIGYVSPDLRQHSCAYFFEAIFKYFDRSRFIIYCYANVEKEDRVSEKVKGYEGIQWYNIYNKPTSEVCQLIRQHEIDILIDLAGHTSRNRLNVFACKPAPIQVAYLGYPNTTGLKNIDYRITDRIADPTTTKQKYSEKLVYLPRCFICYTPSIPYDQIQINCARNGSRIVFGVMNKVNKQNLETFHAWGAILRQVPNSQLIIKHDVKCVLQKKMKDLFDMGIGENRIIMVGRYANELDYYQLYNSIDISLDTFPYSGTATSCDSLLMSTPIVTYAIPDRHVSNVTHSLLVNLGCPELVAHSQSDYIRMAVELAFDRSRIMYYKGCLRQKFLELMNGQRFAKEYDQLMSDLIQKSVKG